MSIACGTEFALFACGGTVKMKTPLLALGVIAVLALVATQGCTLGSDTYIQMQEPPVVEDGGAEGGGGGSSSGGSSSGGGDPGGACQRDFAKVDLGTLTACGDGKGHCYAKDKSPLADLLIACPNPVEVCVPDEWIQAAGDKPKSCNSIIGPGGCVTPKLLPELDRQSGGALKQDACAAGQVCAPCVDPTHGNAPTPFCLPIGVYDKACTSAGGGADAGPPPPPAAPCCTTNGVSNGVCFPEASIPEAQREDAPALTCEAGMKCVPKSLTEGKPVKCKAGVILGQGVCMDGCFNTMLGLAGSIGILDRDVCQESESCVPCSFLKDKGVPGCQ